MYLKLISLLYTHVWTTGTISYVSFMRSSHSHSLVVGVGIKWVQVGLEDLKAQLVLVLHVWRCTWRWWCNNDWLCMYMHAWYCKFCLLGDPVKSATIVKCWHSSYFYKHGWWVLNLTLVFSVRQEVAACTTHTHIMIAMWMMSCHVNMSQLNISCRCSFEPLFLPKTLLPNAHNSPIFPVN